MGKGKRINWQLEKKRKKMEKLEKKGRITHNFKIVGTRKSIALRA